MGGQVRSGPLHVLIFFACLFAVIIFYIGLIRAEMAFAASGAEMEPAVRTVTEMPEVQGEMLDEKDAFGAVESGTVADEELPVASTSADTAVEQTAGQAYVTTAHYLNVRAEPHARSQILLTVKKGTVLTVLEPLDNGWLKLEGEGFVHGAYAVPAEQDAAEPRMAVKSAPGRDAEEGGMLHQAGRKAAQPQTAVKPARKSHEVISRSGLTKEDISQIFEGTDLSGHGLEDAVLEVEEKYGINAYFTIAVMKLESGNGKSRLARVKNNLFGLNATGGNNEQAYSFETKADSVHKFGQLIAEKYVDKGLTTIEKVGQKYCPSNEKWADLIVRIMKSDQLKV